jgi:hypothetical protein
MFYRHLFDNVLQEYEHIKYDADGDRVMDFRVDSWEEWNDKLPVHYKQKHLIAFLKSKYPRASFERFIDTPEYSRSKIKNTDNLINVA